MYTHICVYVWVYYIGLHGSGWKIQQWCSVHEDGYLSCSGLVMKPGWFLENFRSLVHAEKLKKLGCNDSERLQKWQQHQFGWTHQQGKKAGKMQQLFPQIPLCLGHHKKYHSLWVRVSLPTQLLQEVSLKLSLDAIDFTTKINHNFHIFIIRAWNPWPCGC